MSWQIPLIGGSLTAAVAFLILVSGDARRPRVLGAIVVTLATGAAACGAMWVVLGQKAHASAWSSTRIENAFTGMAAAVLSGLVAIFLPIVLERRGIRWWAASLVVSVFLLMFAFLGWFGAVSW